MNDAHLPPLRLTLDGQALVENWRALDRLSGAANTGAAVKANGYGLGAVDVVARLRNAGCRDFFVASWQEAAQISEVATGCGISVLNGVREEDLADTAIIAAKPVLNTIAQLERWRGTGKPCDVMIDSGMNRLGLSLAEVRKIDWSGLDVDVAMSHLASADEDVLQNSNQLRETLAAFEHIPAKRQSLANSAGIALGNDYHFDLTRPGLSLYGGVQRPELQQHISSVVTAHAQILQKRMVPEGGKIGYNAKFVAGSEMAVAIIALGYADGYFRGFSNAGSFVADDNILPVLGRVSMDLIALDLSNAPGLQEGDWVDLPFELPVMADQSGMSQYELITGMGQRYARRWID